MLSISNVCARQAGSYYGKDGYYARMDDRDNAWYGKLREELGLPDQIRKEDFDGLIHEHEQRAGFDLCFSAPKSVSVAMCLDGQTRADMLEAHHRAVEKILAQIEENEIGTRITHHKAVQHVKTGNMICGRFNHYVSRSQDPQLHTHCVILNKTLYNGWYYTVDNPGLYQNKMLYGQLYRNALAAELLGMGYDVVATNREKGFFELAGISLETLDHFSTRRKEIIQQLKEWEADSAVSAAKATLLTREAKQNRDIKILMQSWKESLTELGGDRVEKRNAPIVPAREEIATNFERAILQMNRSSFAFTEREFRKMALAHGVATGLTKGQFEELFHREIGREIMDLGKRLDQGDNHAYYCTKKNYEMEQEIFQEVARTKNTMSSLSAKQVDDYLKQYAAAENGDSKLRPQQKEAVKLLATTRDQYCVIQGLAGTGKTYMLDYARRVLEANGYEVKGACYTGKAANGLQKDARITSATLHSFLNRLEKETGHLDLDENFKEKQAWIFDGLKPGTKKEVWIVDEASMVDNLAMRYLMKAAELKKAKVCFVGDRQQLLPVGVGNAFDNLVRNNKISYVTMDDIQRQKDQELLESVTQAVKKDIFKSFEILENKQAVTEIVERKVRINAMVSEFVSLPTEQREKTVVLTAENQDRKDLNRKIRRQLKERGELQGGIKFQVKDAGGSTYTREFAPGDKVIFLQNDTKLGVQNGQTGFVENVAGDQLTVRYRADQTIPPLVVNLKEYDCIDHGYAMTTHKAQGITEDKAIIHLDSAQSRLNSRNSYYVDISRARWEVKIFCDNPEKIKKQVKDFATKLTSDDFLIPKGEKSPRITLDDVKRICRDTFDRMADSVTQLRAQFKSVELPPPGIGDSFEMGEAFRMPEPTRETGKDNETPVLKNSKPKGPSFE